MRSTDPTFPLFSVFSLLGFVLSVIPLTWHLQAWNSGTCAFMLWTGIFCLVTFVNSLVWAGNVNNVAPVWCDISSQIILGAGVGIPSSVLCISRRLYHITAIQTVSVTRDDKRRAVYIDLAIALGLPVFVLLLHIIVQPHRFDILEDYGCSPVTYNTLPAYFLFYMWPLLIGMVSLVFSSLTLRSFYQRRLQFNQLLASNTAMNASRYFRLMLLAILDIMCTIPFAIYTIYVGVHRLKLAPWISWDDTHFDFLQVDLVPSLIWRSDPSFATSIELSRWLPVACSFIFFALFGFAEEALKNYKRLFWFFASRLGTRPSSSKVDIPSFKLQNSVSPTTEDSLPVYYIRKDSESPTSPNESNMDTLHSSSSLVHNKAGYGSYTDKISCHTYLPTSPSSPSSPPSYSASSHDVASIADTEHSSPARSFAMLPDAESRPGSIYTATSDLSLHHISISDACPTRSRSPLSETHDVPLPSPDRLYIAGPLAAHARQLSSASLPLEHAAATPYHRPFSPPSVYPASRAHAPGEEVCDGIMVTIHTHTVSSETL